jgi:beta-aspartyl-peptidase (threonine type)
LIGDVSRRKQNVNRSLLGALLIWLLAAGNVWPQARQREESAIQRVLQDQVAAWNRGDLVAFMSGYWKSPDLTFFSGKEKTSGWEATIARYRKRYQEKGANMGKLSFTDLDVEALGPDAAFVRGQFHLVRSKDTLTGRFTLIFKKFPEGWRIVHDHTS